MNDISHEINNLEKKMMTFQSQVQHTLTAAQCGGKLSHRSSFASAVVAAFMIIDRLSTSESFHSLSKVLCRSMDLLRSRYCLLDLSGAEVQKSINNKIILTFYTVIHPKTN